jgi:DNA polymerase-3 subunit delta'
MPRIADIIGQPGAVRLLTRLIARGRLPHAVLLCGPAGCGRRTLAMALAQALLCAAPRGGDACGGCDDCRLAQAGTHPDLVALPNDTDPVPQEMLDLYEREEGRAPGTEIASGQLIPAAWTRLAIAAAASESSLRGHGRAFVLPAIERLGGTAANALLKVLEEPPPGVRFIMTCEQPGGILPTIRSRSQSYRLQPLDAAGVAEVLERGGVDMVTARQRSTTAQGSHRGLWTEAEDPGPVDAMLELLGSGINAGTVATVVDALPGKGPGDAGERRRALRGWLTAASERLRLRLREADPAPAIAGLARIVDARRLLDRNQDPRLVVETLGL